MKFKIFTEKLYPQLQATIALFDGALLSVRGVRGGDVIISCWVPLNKADVFESCLNKFEHPLYKERVLH